MLQVRQIVWPLKLCNDRSAPALDHPGDELHSLGPARSIAALALRVHVALVEGKFWCVAAADEVAGVHDRVAKPGVAGAMLTAGARPNT